MAIDYDRLMALEIPDVIADYSASDAILYALGLGIGADPEDPAQLAFLYEKDLKVLPTLALTLGAAGAWLRDCGIDYSRIVHGEQSLDVHAPLPSAGRITARSRITDVIDKGEGRGALLYYERTLVLDGQSTPTVTMRQTIFCRGDGGFGGPSRTQAGPHVLPSRTPDLSVRSTTVPQQALIYRLSGDLNPLHADPEVARRVGFPKPILHGLATFGIAAYGLIRGLGDGDPGRLRQMGGRFTAPVFPGETFETDMWRDGDLVSFRTRALERDVVAIDNGRARLG